MRNKIKSSNHLPSYPAFLGFTLVLMFSTSFCAVERDREWGLQSVHYTLYLLLLPLHTLPLLQHGVPQTSPMWVLPMGCSSALTAPEWISFMGCSPPVWVPHGKPANLLWCGLLYPWDHRSYQEPAPAWALHRVAASFGHPPAPMWGLPGLQLEICSTVDLHGLQGTACLTRVCSTGCRGISAPAPGAPPSLLLHWPWRLQSCFSHIISFLSPAAKCHQASFLPPS